MKDRESMNFECDIAKGLSASVECSLSGFGLAYRGDDRSIRQGVDLIGKVDRYLAARM
jgi:hypothetical protein